MLDPTKLEELKKKHGPLHQLDAGGDAIVVRVPTRGEWKKFLGKSGDGGLSRADALENLLRDCTVDPGDGELSAMLERRPGLAVTFANELTELAGAGVRVQKKEL